MSVVLLIGLFLLWIAHTGQGLKLSALKAEVEWLRAAHDSVEFHAEQALRAADPDRPAVPIQLDPDPDVNAPSFTRRAGS